MIIWVLDPQKYADAAIHDRYGEVFAETMAAPSIYASPRKYPVPAEIRPALAKALADPVVVKWAKDNDLIMKPKTPQEAAATLADQRAFFDKWKSVLGAS